MPGTCSLDKSPGISARSAQNLLKVLRLVEYPRLTGDEILAIATGMRELSAVADYKAKG
jgi:hypothetical protein